MWPGVYLFQRTFWAFVVNGDLINNKKSAVIEFWNCIMNVMCHLDVKFYTFKELIAEYNLAVELKNQQFRSRVWTLSSFWCEELALEVCSSVVDTCCSVCNLLKRIFRVSVSTNCVCCYTQTCSASTEPVTWRVPDTVSQTGKMTRP
jgi:hypothetical protein